MAFGKWSVSPIYSKVFEDKVFVGDGANCNCHINGADPLIGVRNPERARCKKFISITRTVDAEAARMMAKVWLVKGTFIASSDPLGRHAHTFCTDYSDPWEFGTEAQLDAWAASLHL